LRLLIEDDGKGFDTGEIKNGNGLVNMRRRTDSMKGIIQIDSASGKGTRISVDVPLT
jgi:signal transduction histidine kinase